jgi:hypothetical protein
MNFLWLLFGWLLSDEQRTERENGMHRENFFLMPVPDDPDEEHSDEDED